MANEELKHVKTKKHYTGSGFALEIGACTAYMLVMQVL